MTFFFAVAVQLRANTSRANGNLSMAHVTLNTVTSNRSGASSPATSVIQITISHDGIATGLNIV